LAADLVRRRAAVIAAFNTPSVVAAKAATQTIPIVFAVGADPLKSGLIASLNRPGGNLTGIVNLSVEVAVKRLELLHELVPGATAIAYLVNPTNPIVVETELTGVQLAADTLGVHLLVLNATNQSEIEAAFTTLPRQRATALLLNADPLFITQRDQLVTLAARYALPAIYVYRESTAAGGLMSYGTRAADFWRLAGVYTGRILKGEKPADLPVQQATKVEFTINLKTARALGLTFPLTLLGRADEVIE
jgi:putative ABC transport system substrate-binding protein